VQAAGLQALGIAPAEIADEGLPQFLIPLDAMMRTCLQALLAGNAEGGVESDASE
jgi:hypothetical protein